MAEAESDRSILNDAVLRVWTPAVGVQSIQELLLENLLGILGITDKKSTFIPFVLAICAVYKSAFQTDLAKYFDNDGPFQLKNALVSGSWSEGLIINFEFSPPDVDFMCVLKNIQFTTRDQLCGNLKVREDTPFVNAYITDEACAKLWKDFLHDCSDNSSKNHHLSSYKLKEKLSQNYSNAGNLFQPLSDNVQYHLNREPDSAALTVDNGRPADYTPISNSEFIGSIIDALYDKANIPNLTQLVRQNLQNFFFNHLPSSDIVLALSCDGWPLCANEWITRHRMWPDQDLVKEITQNGFHIVPKSSREGDFRLSFSYAETTLIKHLSTLQHKLMRSFKGVVKYHQSSWDLDIQGVITTYHLKTIAFWYFEKKAQDSFSDDTVATHLILLLRELADALMKRELPMYFMPKVNLLEDVENHEEVIDIVEKIIQLSTNYATITQTVEKLSKYDLKTASKDFVNDFIMLWEREKQSRNSNVQDQVMTSALIPSQFQSLIMKFSQFCFTQDEESQPSTSHNDSEDIRDDILSLQRNVLDLMLQKK